MTVPQRSKKPGRRRSPVSAFRSRLKESEARYASLIDHLPVGVYRTNPEGRILAANPTLVEMLGYRSEAELRGVNVKDLYVRGKDREDHLRSLDRRLVCFTEFKLRRRGGGTIWGQDYPRAVLGPGGSVAYYDGILVDVTQKRTTEERLRKILNKVAASNRERRQMIKKLETLSVTDDLTGLYNRRGFMMMARHSMQVADRRKVLMFLLFLDMDDLKVINDSLGHAAGDEALRRMAVLLRTTFRESDVKGRMGGDEFAVFPVDTTIEGVHTALARLGKNVQALNQSGVIPFRLAYSAGIAYYDPSAPSTIEELLTRADRRMYVQKEQKRHPV